MYSLCGMSVIAVFNKKFLGMSAARRFSHKHKLQNLSSMALMSLKN